MLALVSVGFDAVEKSRKKPKQIEYTRERQTVKTEIPLVRQKPARKCGSVAVQRRHWWPQGPRLIGLVKLKRQQVCHRTNLA